MDLGFLLYSFVTLFIIVDPIANVPFFLHLAGDITEKDYRDLIKRAITVACAVLIIFSTGSKYIFEFLGIQMFSFRIASGILLFIISLEMIFGRRTRTEVSPEEEEEYHEDLAITPMAVPLLTGPGAISTGIVLFNSAQSFEERMLFFIAVALVFLASYVILYFSHEIFAVLGKTGTRVVIRIMGLLLSAIAVQFIFDGIAQAIASLR